MNATVTDLKTKVSDLETSANAKEIEFQEMKGELRDLNRKVEDQARDIAHLMKRADQSDQNNLELERHSRSSNLRFGNIQETTGEDCKEKVLAALTQFDLGEVDIENVHRVGEKKEGKTRFIIVRFVRRLERRLVLAKRKEFFNKEIPLYEDLPKSDLTIKKKFAKEIAQHHINKDKCYFSRGVWYVNGIKKYW